jgi:ferritin-like metal-binding protein YciE
MPGGSLEILGKAACGKICPAIDRILEEGSEILEEYKGSTSLDAGLVGAAQAVEHYEIARYASNSAAVRDATAAPLVSFDAFWVEVEMVPGTAKRLPWG